MEYMPRLVDSQLDILLPELPAIAIDGAKGVGKTATAARRVGQVFGLDTTNGLNLFKGQMENLATLESVLIDEWQCYPESWNLVRHAVDAGAEPGQFLLTGSATPVDSSGTHTGAGRIVSLHMRPMGFSERQLVEPTVSFQQLLESGGATPIQGSSDFKLADYAEEICRSGLPAIRKFSQLVRTTQLDTYIERIVDRDLPEAGFTSRDRETLLRWLRAYAAASSTTASYNSLISNVYASESAQPAKTTVLNYQRHLERIWIVDPIPGWSPSFNPLKHTGQAPKHNLADPALAAALMGLNHQALLTQQWVGFLSQLFESLVALTVRALAAANFCKTKHMRLHKGQHEIDLIVERRDGAILPIEVKMTQAVTDHDARHLDWLAQTWQGPILDRAIIYCGTHAYRTSNGIAVIPLALLGP